MQLTGDDAGGVTPAKKCTQNVNPLSVNPVLACSVDEGSDLKVLKCIPICTYY